MLISDALEAATPLLLRQAQRSLAERVLSQDAPPEPAALLRAGQAAQSRAHATLEEALPRLLQALLRGEALPEPPARED